jgi:hypothetical protein
MKRWFYHIAPLLAVLIAAPAAAAGWDRVAWGATAAEIAAAYGERARVLDPPIDFGAFYAQIVLLDVPYAGYPFRVYFQMDPRTKRLAHVLLERRRQYASPNAWNAVVKALDAELGRPDHACNRVGERGKPTIIDGIWQREGDAVEASYLDFATPVIRYSPEATLPPEQLLEVQPFYRNLYPARRILIRYSPAGTKAMGC